MNSDHTPVQKPQTIHLHSGAGCTLLGTIKDNQLTLQRTLYRRWINPLGRFLPEILVALLIVPLLPTATVQAELIEQPDRPETSVPTPEQTTNTTPTLASETDYLAAKQQFQMGHLDKAAKQLADNPTPLARPKVSRLYAEIVYSQSHKIRSHGEFSVALERCLVALKYAPEHRQAQKLKGQLLEQAKELFIEGYTLELIEPEVAAHKYQRVLDRLEPIAGNVSMNHYYLRAKERLESL